MALPRTPLNPSYVFLFKPKEEGPGRKAGAGEALTQRLGNEQSPITVKAHISSPEKCSGTRKENPKGAEKAGFMVSK